MTDTEKLIEEAAKAIWSATDALTWEQTTEDMRDSCRVEARAALAVFEKAHTPPDDEREALREHAEMCGCALPRCEFIQGWGSAWDAAYRSILRRSEVPEHPAIAEIKSMPIESVREHIASRRLAPQGEPSDARVEAAARRLFGATVDSMNRARELARVALTAPPLIACPHWAPGKITFRNGCTACATDAVTEQGQNRD